MPADARSGGAHHPLAGKSAGAGMNQKTGLTGTKQVSCQLDNQMTAMIKWDVATVRFPIASVRRLTMQGNIVVFEEEHMHIEQRNGKKTELVIQGNV